MITASQGQFTMKVRRLTDIQPLNAVKAIQAKIAQQANETKPVSAANNTPTETDADMFRSLIGPVREFIAPAIANKSPPPAPDAAMSRADEAHVMEELLDLPDDPARLDGAEAMSYLRDGQSPKLLRKLKRAQFRISDEFDLHHLTFAVAKKALHQFLHSARRQEKLCVLVIHGKGLRSGESGAVLKSMVDFELRRRKDVIAFSSAPSALGGTGAALILLQGS
jgi:DNA-nicking Smr family endonuclease